MGEKKGEAAKKRNQRGQPVRGRGKADQQDEGDYRKREKARGGEGQGTKYATR